VSKLTADPAARPVHDRQLRPWVTAAERLIGDRLTDARAHAAARDLGTAGDRIAELHRGLLGDPSVPGGLVAEARAGFYRAAFDEPHNPAIHAEGLAPEPAGEHTARYAPIAGRNQYVDARNLIDTIGANLQLTALAADPEHRAAWLADWHRRSFDRLTGHIRASLSDAQMSLSEAVGRIRIKPELL
jgi:hypothetical protein